MLTVTPVRAFSDNYIWLAHAPRDLRQVAIVDPGEASPVREALRTQRLAPAAILLTHHHADHVGGAAELSSEFDVPIYGPASERLPFAVKPLKEGDVVALDSLGLHLEVLDIPGHTAGHIAYVGHGAVFCGDTLFSAGCGRLFEGTPAQMHASLGKLKGLPESTTVFCGHEYTVANLGFAATVEPQNSDIERHPGHSRELRSQGQPTLPSTIGLERKINPFLRCGFETVKQAAERQAARELDSETEVFAVLRTWKDGFRA
jgi:hydroxyacylglutathione hydrolase